MHTQPVEDIDAVMGRFQAWTGTRATSKPRAGVRELSCEEALQSRRYHWKADDDLSSDAKSAPASATPPQPAPLKSSEADHKSAAKARTRNHGAKPQTQAAAPKAVAATKTAGKTRPRPPAPQFKDALAKAVRPAEVVLAPAQALTSAQTGELARQVAISIRLAPSERALIRTRAAEAGITVSAYIRQCALEVEQLRAQVQQTLAAMEHATAAPAAQPAPAPGLFARMLRRFFPATVQTLAVRV